MTTSQREVWIEWASWPKTEASGQAVPSTKALTVCNSEAQQGRVESRLGNTVNSSICSSLSTPHTRCIHLSTRIHTGTLYLLCTSCARTAYSTVYSHIHTHMHISKLLPIHTPAQTHPGCSLYVLMHTYAHEHTIFVCIFTHIARHIHTCT